MARAIVIALAAAVVGVAAVTSLHGGGKRARGSTGGDSLRLTFAYSPNQEQLLAPLIRRFNDERHAAGGRDIAIVGESVASGDVEGKVATGTYRPTIWSPASSLWGRLLNFRVRAPWVADENPSIVRTPLVIALWKPEAQALGWPLRPIGFGRILELATSRGGWAAYGLPTFGRFKLGHTNPDFSTSGLSFVAAQYYTATGKREGLTITDVNRGAVRAKVHQVEESIVHYGDTSQFFLDQLQAHGPGYVSALAMEEVSLLDYNRTRPKGSMPLVAIYPREGTFYFDNPLIVLHAPWVTAAQARAAKLFERWLLPKLTPSVAARFGYRPGDLRQHPTAPIDRAHFVDPMEPRIVLGLPEPRVLAAIKTAWHTDRKAANVEIVVDTSGSMNDEDKLRQAREGLLVFLRQFSPRDRVGLVTFSRFAQTIVPIAEMTMNRRALEDAVSNLTAGGGTAVYDATAQGVAEIAALHDSTRINAVVVLTDGEDNASRTTTSQLEAGLVAHAEDQEHNVRVFTIAYGGDANKTVLESIAAASGGNAYVGDPNQIADVYRQISSFSEMTSQQITRRVLARELVVNAVTKPLNVGVPAAVAAAGLLMNTIWLLPVALLVYLAMLVATFVDGDEAAHVGRLVYDRARTKRRPKLDSSRFAPPIADKLELALAEEERILAVARSSPLLTDPTPEIVRLLEDLEHLADGAQRLFEYLAGHDESTLRRRLVKLRELGGVDAQVAAANERAAAALEAQLTVVDELRGQLLRFYAQMDHTAASLATIHGQIVRLTVTEELASHDDVADHVRRLRVEVSAAADALHDAYSELSELDGPNRKLTSPPEDASVAIGAPSERSELGDRPDDEET